MLGLDPRSGWKVLVSAGRRRESSASKERTTVTTIVPNQTANLQRTIEAIVGPGIIGITARVNDERGEWVGSAGAAELGGDAKPPADGHIRIGSNTKTFTATLVLQLVAEGRIGLDDPVTDHLPEFGIDERITVRMLLQQTSGLFNFTGEVYENGSIVLGIPMPYGPNGKEWLNNRFKTYRPHELVELALSKPARF